MGVTQAAGLVVQRSAGGGVALVWLRVCAPVGNSAGDATGDAKPTAFSLLEEAGGDSNAAAAALVVVVVALDALVRLGSGACCSSAARRRFASSSAFFLSLPPSPPPKPGVSKRSSQKGYCSGVPLRHVKRKGAHIEIPPTHTHTHRYR